MRDTHNFTIMHKNNNYLLKYLKASNLKAFEKKSVYVGWLVVVLRLIVYTRHVG